MEEKHTVADSAGQDQASESGLINAVKRGDRIAYHEIYKRHCGRVYALCLRMTGEKSMAEDATQEVFIQVWRKIRSYRGDSKFSTWLHAVASNTTLQYMRKQRGWASRYNRLEDEEIEDPVPQDDTAMDDLEKYIMRLPERARQVFVLHAVEGYRHEEIAGMMKIATATSKSQFFRARNLMQEWLTT